MFIFSIPAATIFSAASSYIIESAGTNTTPVSGSTIGAIVYLPTIEAFISSAAIIPTASPILTSLPVARFLP